MRPDGKRVRDADPIYTIAPYIMTRRYDALNMITLDIPIEPIHNYIKAQRAKGNAMSHMAIIFAAYLRTVWEFPKLNRFIVNKRIYDRNEFCAALVVLRPGDDETMSKVYFDTSESVLAVQKKMEQYVAESQSPQIKNSMDRIMGALLKIPGLLGFAVGFLKLLDKFGLLPKSVIDASPFHTSLTLTNLASIRTNHIYHHIYEFGTTSVFISMGNMREVPLRTGSEVVITRCLPLGMVMDERICSGSYFAKAFARFRYYLENPAVLEEPAKKE